MESSSHGAGFDSTVQDAPSPRSTTQEPDLPTSSLELGDSIEILPSVDDPSEPVSVGATTETVTLSMMELESSQTEQSTAEETSALAAVPTSVEVGTKMRNEST